MMVAKVLLAALAVVLTLVPSTALAQQRAELERIIKRRVLPNGLEVIVVENHGIPLATIEIDVRNGSLTQTPEFAGLAHMYEHMFFKANLRYPDADAFLDRAGELGAIFNASTVEERVNYYMTLPADSLEGGMALMAAAVRFPLFREDELERERAVVLGEYDRQESSPFFRLTQAVGRKLWPKRWSRKNIIGDREVIRTTTPAKMRAIQRRYYIPNNAALIVTGDVEPNQVFALAERIYGDWKSAPDPFALEPIPPIQPLEDHQAVVAEAEVGAVTVLIQWQGPSVGKDRDATYAADVFSDALNTPGSPFQRRLVDSGLFQAIGVNYYTLNHTGPITISGQTSPDRLRQALAALDREIERFDDPNYFTRDELVAVKAQRAVSSAFGVERTSGLTHTIGFWWAVADLDYFLGYVDNMAKQTPNDLRDYARRYITGKPRVTGVLLSGADRQAIRLSERDLQKLWERS